MHALRRNGKCHSYNQPLCLPVRNMKCDEMGTGYISEEYSTDISISRMFIDLIRQKHQEPEE